MADYLSDTRKRVTTLELIKMKREGRKIVMITAYDALFGALVDAAGVDVVLVGDSVAPVLAGEETTIPATVEQMIYHGRIVRRGVRRALVVVDMPFLRGFHLLAFGRRHVHHHGGRRPCLVPGTGDLVGGSRYRPSEHCPGLDLPAGGAARLPLLHGVGAAHEGASRAEAFPRALPWRRSGSAEASSRVAGPGI